MYSTVNAMNQLKKSLFMEYNLLYKRNLSFAAANRPGETLRAAVRKYRLGVCKMKKSKIPKLRQNIGLGKLFLEK